MLLYVGTEREYVCVCACELHHQRPLSETETWGGLGQLGTGEIGWWDGGVRVGQGCPTRVRDGSGVRTTTGTCLDDFLVVLTPSRSRLAQGRLGLPQCTRPLPLLSCVRCRWVKQSRKDKSCMWVLFQFSVWFHGPLRHDLRNGRGRGSSTAQPLRTGATRVVGSSPPSSDRSGQEGGPRPW